MSDATPNLFRRLWREHISPYRNTLLLALLLMAIEGASVGAFAYLNEPLFDQVFVAGNSSAVLWVSLGICSILLVRAISGFGQRILLIKVGLRVTTALQSRLLRHILGLDASFFQSNPPGALIERVRGDTLALQGLASSVLLSLGRDSITILSLLAVMLWSDWLWTLLALIGIPLLVLPLSRLQALIRKASRHAREVAARLTMQLDEVFHGITSIKVNRLEAHEAERFEAEVERFLDVQLKAERGKAANPALIDFVAAFGFLALILYGGSQIVAGDKTLGQFMTFFISLALIFDPMRKLSAIAGQIQSGMASLERLYAVLEEQPTILTPADPQPLTPGDLNFNEVHFAYGDKPVLQGLNFSAEAGKTTALVGSSGAGKSTVFGLITRLIEPQSGRISISGTALETADLAELRDHIAMVGQETALFDASIAENIRLGRLDASQEEIAAAAEAASVMEFAGALPQGLETPVGPRGSALSGGQRQRVAIARAMLRDAPILLLDEPTSALDARSEQLVSQALTRLAQGRTTLIIAHRLSTIREADCIVVMDQGRVVESGSHAELMEAKGAYARLNQLQSAGLTAGL